MNKKDLGTHPHSARILDLMVIKSFTVVIDVIINMFRFTRPVTLAGQLKRVECGVMNCHDPAGATKCRSKEVRVSVRAARIVRAVDILHVRLCLVTNLMRLP